MIDVFIYSSITLDLRRNNIAINMKKKNNKKTNNMYNI